MEVDWEPLGLLNIKFGDRYTAQYSDYVISMINLESPFSHHYPLFGIFEDLFKLFEGGREGGVDCWKFFFDDLGFSHGCIKLWASGDIDTCAGYLKSDGPVMRLRQPQKFDRLSRIRRT